MVYLFCLSLHSTLGTFAFLKSFSPCLRLISVVSRPTVLLTAKSSGEEGGGEKEKESKVLKSGLESGGFFSCKASEMFGRVPLHPFAPRPPHQFGLRLYVRTSRFQGGAAAIPGYVGGSFGGYGDGSGAKRRTRKVHLCLRVWGMLVPITRQA